MVRSGGERMALNTPIQGSAADILKKAMVDLHREMTKRGPITPERFEKSLLNSQHG